MTINDHDWILLYYTNEEKLFLENTDYDHFIKSFKAILDRSVNIVYCTFSDSGFYLLLYIEQAKKIVGRDWNVKTNLYVSLKDLFAQMCDHYNNTTGSIIDAEQLQFCEVLNHNWLLGVNEKEKHKVADAIIYMNDNGSNYLQTDTHYINQTLKINFDFINSRNTKLCTDNFKNYILQHSQKFSNITI
ncbi:MAG: hypothetical protein SGJ10_10240 [Bacteroidota bacterium]|nr:hypothetical protein [Bacteroidota bacterium]